MINREDMLELTRRMTMSRHCLDRIAGAYLDGDGFLDGSFNIHFGKLSPPKMKKKLELAKTVPFSQTNRNLKDYPVPGRSEEARAVWQMLCALNECSLKNDALLYSFYERVGEVLADVQSGADGYALCLVHGCYDVPLKASDKERLWESEEVYRFIICTLSPLAGEYEPGEPGWGFLFPAFSGRSTDTGHIYIYNSDEKAAHPAGDILLA